MPSQAEKANRFRALHERPGTFIIPNPWDVGSARLLEHAGFEALATTSAGVAFNLGRPDGHVTRDEKLAHCRAVCEATDLPVNADLEKCFADDPAGVAETIRLAAATGLAGGSVEDSTGDPANPIFAFDLAVERVRAAVAAARAQSFPFMLTARAENLLHGRRDMADTIKRLQAFEAAGADVLYAPGLSTLDEVRAVVSAVKKPVNVLHDRGRQGVHAGVAGCGRSQAYQRGRRSLPHCLRRRPDGCAGDEGQGDVRLHVWWCLQ